MTLLSLAVTWSILLVIVSALAEPITRRIFGEDFTKDQWAMVAYALFGVPMIAAVLFSVRLHRRSHTDGGSSAASR